VTLISVSKLIAGGLNLPGEHDAYDFGSGNRRPQGNVKSEVHYDTQTSSSALHLSAAGFYINATTDGYRDHYRMYDYITKVHILRGSMRVNGPLPPHSPDRCNFPLLLRSCPRTLPSTFQRWMSTTKASAATAWGNVLSLSGHPFIFLAAGIA
jgi:hypothetical protein